jgi:hypothetical protein
VWEVRHQPAPNYTQSYTPNTGDRAEQHVQPIGRKKNLQRKCKTDSDWPKSEKDKSESGERQVATPAAINNVIAISVYSGSLKGTFQQNFSRFVLVLMQTGLKIC